MLDIATGDKIEESLIRINHKGVSLLSTGASHRIQFWRGYHSTKLGKKPHYVPNSQGQACYAAGQDFRKIVGNKYIGFLTTGNYTMIDQA